MFEQGEHFKELDQSWRWSWQEEVLLPHGGSRTGANVCRPV